MEIKNKLDLSTRIEDNVSNILSYYGYADPGTSSSEAKWIIKRERVVGLKFFTEWANGEAQAESVWDDRTTLSYS